MDPISIPRPLVTGVMKHIPPRILEGAVTVLMRRIERNHARLFMRLTDMDAASIGIDPLDLPHKFILRLGAGGVLLSVVTQTPPPVTANIKGTLAALLDLLEGKSDGDALFFSRDIILTGDTSAIVALRNILDGTNIHVIEEVLSMSGPLSKPMRVLLSGAERLAQRVRARMEAPYQIRQQNEAANANVAALECARLRDEIQTLRTRLAKADMHRKRTGRISA